MSHFSVAVILENLEDLEEVMLPYVSECTGCCPEEFLEFYDETEDLRMDYQDNTRLISVVKFKDGTMKRDNDDSLLVKVDGNERAIQELFEKEGLPYKTTMVYEDGQRVKKYYDYLGKELQDVPYNVLFPTFEEYVEYLGIDFDENNGGFGYYMNPNAKWDSFRIGGRYRNMLKAKEGQYGKSLPWEHDITCVDGFYDVAKIKDIDFRFDVDKYNEAKYKWEVLFEGASPDKLNDDEYAILKHSADSIRKMYMTKELYCLERSTIITSAVITPDGEWHEESYYSNSKENKKWISEYYNRFFKDVDKEYYVVIVDCHI